METSGCTHLESIRDVRPSTTAGCEDCLRTGSPWVHLRLCLECGHVGCCDSSPNRHATKHFHATSHPVIRSFEPGEDWGWCYEDEVMLEGDALRPAAAPHAGTGVHPPV
ncbi:UBP-type zinc finger domain-containing protein [Archangium gephyra]|uniref:ubiquitin carboxyl-terminal hydrolase 14 n=1 Tax=Archangium gephyra TaxID=48 RepID=UPI0035D45E51